MQHAGRAVRALVRRQALIWLVVTAGCGRQPDPNAPPACDAPEVQEVARKVAAETVKIPFTLSSFSEIEAESAATRRSCRVRAKHAASGATLWLRFTLERRPAKRDKNKSANAELAVVFAPIL